MEIEDRIETKIEREMEIEIKYGEPNRDCGKELGSGSGSK
jgi:hypothetical protein